MSPSAFVPALGCRAIHLNCSTPSVTPISTTHLSHRPSHRSSYRPSHRPSFRPRSTLETPTPQAPLSPRPTQTIPVLSPTYTAPTSPSPAPAVVLIIPGYGSPYTDYLPLEATLQAALPSALVRTVPVTTLTWARTLGGRPVTPVLDLIAAAVASARLDAPASPITLVAHSAAGWIARIFISTSAQYFGTTYAGAGSVDRLVCLGTPQRSAEKITMANMAFVNTECANCEQNVEYVCVGGTGVAFDGPGGGSWRFWEDGWISRVSYGITAGEGALEGDGIVPTECFYLDGAMNVELEGVWHSPKSPGPWYGDERAVAYWSTLIRG